MNTFWLKIAGVAVVIVGVIILVNVFSSSETKTAPEPENRPKTVYDQWQKDDEKLRAEPQFKEPPTANPPVQPSNEPPIIQQPKPVAPPKPEFEKLSLEDEVEAQRLWEWVVNQRKMGRLPIMGYGQMVKTCRQIIQRWPESEYAFKAKRALADLPERYRKMYNITDKEIDLGNFR